MPQMAPIGWLNLFIIFSIIFILFNVMNYYSFSYKTIKSNNINELETSSLNWKW
uniref:ATP synthase F0 subunit 8 n=1 Tax=Ironomyia nigromaculata TaxID=1262307 RepID=UPI0026E3C76C|nr:ATP synthase F0 subunit 8 [Ironomyia nigromaculata]WJW73661.1 ATP synthase F0 subunit 8 [Ironomyia nigromaculata]